MGKIRKFLWGSKRRKIVFWSIFAFLWLGGIWTNGTFDYALVNLHLNFNECARNGFGATFCGPDLEEYKDKIGSYSRYSDE
jgi:hypothetical protein